MIRPSGERTARSLTQTSDRRVSDGTGRSLSTQKLMQFAPPRPWLRIVTILLITYSLEIAILPEEPSDGGWRTKRARRSYADGTSVTGLSLTRSVRPPYDAKLRTTDGYTVRPKTRG